MTTRFHTHLYFETECRDAMTRYQAVFGGDLQVDTFGEIGTEGDPDKVLGASLRTPGGLVLTAGDRTPGSTAGTGGSISISGDDEATLRGGFDALADGGQVHMPLEKQMWGEIFGQCVDRFGVTWLVFVEPGRNRPRSGDDEGPAGVLGRGRRGGDEQVSWPSRRRASPG